MNEFDKLQDLAKEIDPVELDLKGIAKEMLEVFLRNLKDSMPPGHSQLLVDNENVALICAEISFQLLRRALHSYEYLGPEALPKAIEMTAIFADYFDQSIQAAMGQFVEEILK